MNETFLENLLFQGLLVILGLIFIVRERKSKDVSNQKNILILCLKIVTTLMGALFCYSIYYGFLK